MRHKKCIASQNSDFLRQLLPGMSFTRTSAQQFCLRFSYSALSFNYNFANIMKWLHLQ